MDKNGTGTDGVFGADLYDVDFRWGLPEYGYRRKSLCRNKSISSSVLPTISIMVDQASLASGYSDAPGTRRGSLAVHGLNHSPMCNSISESHYSYHSHPNLNIDLQEGTMYTHPRNSVVNTIPNEMFLGDRGMNAHHQHDTAGANHIRSSFLAQ